MTISAFIIVNSVLSVVLYLLIFVTTQAEGQGFLLLRVACYNHPSNRLLNGRLCDAGAKCDPKFRFCLSTSKRLSDECNVLRTFSFIKRQQLGECSGTSGDNFPNPINITLNTVSPQLYLTVKVDEVDKAVIGSKTKEIDDIRYELWPRLPTMENLLDPKTSDYSTLNISSRTFTGQFKPQFDLRGLLQCPYQRYGPYCTSSCAPTEQYTCSGNGTKICKSGWRGSNCTLRDRCAPKPCKSWAECRNKEPDTFVCICDGGTGPQCLKGTDPCLNHRCTNNATCVDFGTERPPKCLCKPGWRGKLCNLRDPCWPNRCGQHGRCDLVPSNDTEITIHCICDKGYDGQFCEISLVTTGDMVSTSALVPKKERDGVRVTVVLGLLGMFVVAGVMIAAILCYCQRRITKPRSDIRQEQGRTAEDNLLTQPDGNSPV